ncbi:Rhodanese-like domain-containing protein [Crucibulum laeve]|uniref:Rhodanese-like domain-containing protein n=1 Tax=Crucibulum laeve TaxID=68775 RepID=A0A5C3MJM9_9AGAR|nr:Rhodanese-like domain-containing protein [Crucibulum laeve]
MASLLRRASHNFVRSLTQRKVSSNSVPLLLSPTQVSDLAKSSTPVSILDATWFMPGSPRNARNEYLAKHLPGAQFLDLDEVASPHELGLKHMMPEERVFASACEKLGIEPSSHVVIYDAHGVFSSPRALFMFRSFGHEKSSIINGGLPRWVDEGLPVDNQPPTDPGPTVYPSPAFNKGAIRSYDQVVSNSSLDPAIDPTAELVLDARARGRYLGTDPEPRPGLSSGHIPNSLSLPFNLFLQKHNAKDGSEYTTFLPQAELRQTLHNSVGADRAEQIIKGEKYVVTSCGSGMTAGVLWLGLKLLGVDNVSLYDESWTGYAMRSTSKINKSL